MITLADYRVAELVPRGAVGQLCQAYDPEKGVYRLPVWGAEARDPLYILWHKGSGWWNLVSTAEKEAGSGGYFAGCRDADAMSNPGGSSSWNVCTAKQAVVTYHSPHTPTAEVFSQTIVFKSSRQVCFGFRGEREKGGGGAGVLLRVGPGTAALLHH